MLTSSLSGRCDCRPFLAAPTRSSLTASACSRAWRTSRPALGALYRRKRAPFLDRAAFKDESGRANNHIEVSGAPVDLAPADAEGLSRWAGIDDVTAAGFYASTRACKRAERRGQFVAVVPNSR
jgi:hypothetical protein